MNNYENIVINRSRDKMSETIITIKQSRNYIRNDDNNDNGGGSCNNNVFDSNVADNDNVGTNNRKEIKDIGIGIKII